MPLSVRAVDLSPYQLASVCCTTLVLFISLCMFFFAIGWYIQLLYQLYLAVYIVELFLRLYALRLNFFRSWWNIFSMCLVTC